MKEIIDKAQSVFNKYQIKVPNTIFDTLKLIQDAKSIKDWKFFERDKTLSEIYNESVINLFYHQNLAQKIKDFYRTYCESEGGLMNRDELWYYDKNHIYFDSYLSSYNLSPEIDWIWYYWWDEPLQELQVPTPSELFHYFNLAVNSLIIDYWDDFYNDVLEDSNSSINKSQLLLDDEIIEELRDLFSI